MTYYKYDPPMGWNKSVFIGTEQFYDGSTHPATLTRWRCEVCKEETYFTKMCDNEGCLTIISMMPTEEYRIKPGASAPVQGTTIVVEK